MLEGRAHAMKDFVEEKSKTALLVVCFVRTLTPCELRGVKQS